MFVYISVNDSSCQLINSIWHCYLNGHSIRLVLTNFMNYLFTYFIDIFLEVTKCLGLLLANPILSHSWLSRNGYYRVISGYINIHGCSHWNLSGQVDYKLQIIVIPNAMIVCIIVHCMQSILSMQSWRVWGYAPRKNLKSDAFKLHFVELSEQHIIASYLH